MSQPSTPMAVGTRPVAEESPGRSTTSAIDDVEPPAGEWVLIGVPLAEAALLGCVLRASANEAADLLRPLGESDWSVPAHAQVAAAAAVLLERGEPVDPVTVLGQLRRQGMENSRAASTEAGALLVELFGAAPWAGSGRHYAQIVLEHSYRRRVQQAAGRLMHSAQHAALDQLHALVDHEHQTLTAQRRLLG